MTDSLILMVMALVVFGPRRLPQIGRQIGKLMYEFRKASNDFKFQMEEELRISEEADRRKKEEERQRSLAALAATEQASVSADPPAASTSRRIALSRRRHLSRTSIRLKRLERPATEETDSAHHAALRPARRLQPRGPDRASESRMPRLCRSPPTRRRLNRIRAPRNRREQSEPLSRPRGGTEPAWLMPWKQSARRGRRYQNARNSRA